MVWQSCLQRQKKGQHQSCCNRASPTHGGATQRNGFATPVQDASNATTRVSRFERCIVQLSLDDSAELRSLQVAFAKARAQTQKTVVRFELELQEGLQRLEELRAAVEPADFVAEVNQLRAAVQELTLEQAFYQQGKVWCRGDQAVLLQRPQIVEMFKDSGWANLEEFEWVKFRTQDKPTKRLVQVAKV